MSFKTSIKKVFLFIITLFLSSNLIYANEIDQQIDQAFGNATGWFVKFIFYAIPFSKSVQIPWVLFPLIIGAIYFTIYFNFVNFRNFKTAIQIISGKFDKIDQDSATNVNPSANLHTVDGDIVDTIKDESAKGEVTHFQALTAALSGTVGLGNIAGVAVAISIGGAGATFWMIVAGLIGMASKFTECTLGVKYRDIDANGVVYGGPMYYLRKGLKELNLGGLGKVLAVVFAIMCIGGSFGGGNMFQANQAFKMFVNITGGENSFAMGYGWLFGLIMAVVVAIVIIGGIKSIARVTDKIVPFMIGIYVLASLVIIFMHIGHLGTAIREIVEGAFSAKSVAGGAIGVLIQGFKRAAFSNEAGIGSAPIAHSAVKTKYPASEGLVGLLEPFIDTVVICTMTALIIIITDHHITGASSTDEGVKLTSDAFASVLPWFPYILALAVILFAFSTMISWSYYGVQAWSYLFGRNKFTEYSYKFIFCLFIIIGSASSLGSVIDFSDAMIFAMMIPNMIGLLLLAPKAKKELKRYLDVIKGSS